LLKRAYGKTGYLLSIVGFGGIVVMNESPQSAGRLVSLAIDRGINYFDVAPSYGNAQERLGPALKPYRDSVFLACKTGKRDAPGAEEELNTSLKELKTDRLDLYQFHSVSSMDDVEQITAENGALRTAVKAREAGKIRYIGFSAHSEEAAVSLMKKFTFDSILFPINWAAWYKNGFGKKTVAEAQKQNVGILAIKSLAKRKWGENEKRRWPKAWYSPVDSREEAELAFRFTLSQPVTAAVSPGHAELLWWACDAAEKFAPISKEEELLLEKKSKKVEPIFPKTDT
jgi:aryl-alcohol dehydrogenase-like predicted oxidoreductase